jgi:hypothetical protein
MQRHGGDVADLATRATRAGTPPTLTDMQSLRALRLCSSMPRLMGAEMRWKSTNFLQT